MTSHFVNSWCMYRTVDIVTKKYLAVGFKLTTSVFTANMSDIGLGNL